MYGLRRKIPGKLTKKYPAFMSKRKILGNLTVSSHVLWMRAKP
jgi:hypothetical protein